MPDEIKGDFENRPPSKPEGVPDNDVYAAAKKVAPLLGFCATCGFLKQNKEDGLFYCLGGPAQLVLLPADKKISLAGGPQGQMMELKAIQPHESPSRTACALYDPHGMASLMLEVSRRATFFPELLTDDDKEFIEQFIARK